MLCQIVRIRVRGDAPRARAFAREQPPKISLPFKQAEGGAGEAAKKLKGNFGVALSLFISPENDIINLASDKCHLPILNIGMDEQSMIKKFQSTQNPEAFEAIYDTYIDMVFSRCLYILSERSLAEEAAQDTMVKVYFGLAKFEGRSSLKTWMYRIATNHCFGVLKKRKELSYEELKEEGVQFSDDGDVYKTLEDKSQVTNLLSRLPKDMRGLLVLKYADGYSYEEIAVISGLSQSAVKMRIHRAKLELRALHNTGRV
tara:strand:+ start:286 stop:1059 length:774 start_codon:yes stop_codon:yes gene_type:complete